MVSTLLASKPGRCAVSFVTTDANSCGRRHSAAATMAANGEICSRSLIELLRRGAAVCIWPATRAWLAQAGIGTAGYRIGVTTLLNVRASMPSWKWEVLQAEGEKSHSHSPRNVSFVPQALVCRLWHFALLVPALREWPLQGKWNYMPSSTLWTYPESRLEDTTRPWAYES